MWVTEVPGLTLLGNVSLLCLNYLWFSFPIIKAVECCITFYSNVILLELPEMTESSLGKKILSHLLESRRRIYFLYCSQLPEGKQYMFWLHFPGAVRSSIFIYSDL